MATNNSNFDILIKRRLKGSGTEDAPAINALKSGELAMNENDYTLYYGSSTSAGQISAVPIAGSGYINDVLSTTGADNLNAVTESLTADIDIGGYTAGDEISANTTLTDFIEKLLTKKFNPNIIEPSATLITNAGQVEVGETKDVLLTYNFNRGTINGKTVSGVWQPNTFQDYRSGEATTYDFDSDGDGTFESENQVGNTYTVSSVSFTGAKTFKAQVSYDAGPQPKNSKEENYSTPLAAGVDQLLKTVTVTPKRKIFFGTSSISGATYTNSASIRGLGAYQWADNKTFTITINAGDKHAVFAFPGTGTVVVEDVNLKQNITPQFVQSTVQVDGYTSGQDTTSYSVYKFTNLEGWVANTFDVTIS